MSQDSAELDFDQISFVKRSAYRLHAVETLNGGPATPKEIADATPDEIAHVSRALNELAEEGIAELKVSDDVRKGRIYGLTSAGKIVSEWLSDRGKIGE